MFIIEVFDQDDPSEILETYRVGSEEEANALLEELLEDFQDDPVDVRSHPEPVMI